MKRKVRHYSGGGSEWFWNRVHSLPRQESGETAYVLGCALQNLESFVMNYLENAEMKLRPKRAAGRGE